MTLYDFNKLSLEDKQTTVWNNGTFLDNYITKDIKINCYAIDKFFFEVVYFILLRNNHSFMYRVLTP